MIGIDEIKNAARGLGACARLDGVTTVSEAVNLLQTPQGREFAMRTGYPSLDVWRENADSINLSDVFIDCGEAKIVDGNFIAVGNSRIYASFSEPKQLCHILAMHGAEVLVEAKNYAVVTVTNINAKIKISNDGTAIVNVEQSRIGG